MGFITAWEAVIKGCSIWKIENLYSTLQGHLHTQNEFRPGHYKPRWGMGADHREPQHGPAPTSSKTRSPRIRLPVMCRAEPQSRENHAQASWNLLVFRLQLLLPKQNSQQKRLQEEMAHGSRVQSVAVGKSQWPWRWELEAVGHICIHSQEAES